MKKVVIIGGGISGLISSIILARSGVSCVVIEKKSYPIHRVCGEYISNEATPFLKSLDLFPLKFNPPQISRLLLSSSRGKSETLSLDLGGFGISRFEFDNFLYEQAVASGVGFLLETDVLNVDFDNQCFRVTTSHSTLEALIVLGAHGKRSRLDVQMNREFISRRSPYVGVKYHVMAEYPDDLISLHNFPGGYCGICKVENNHVNVCYLTQRNNLKQHKSINEMEKSVLFTNPLLAAFLKKATRVMEKPEVINEISFASKTPVENHVLMIGDAAGMITPLCGNGMAIAIHCAKLSSELVLEFCRGSIPRHEMEQKYALRWNEHFSKRLWAGRNIQKLFGSDFASSLAINLALHSKPLARLMIRNTHGNAF